MTVDDMIEESVRVERIIWIPGALTDLDSQSRDFVSFCEDMPDKADEPLYQQLPQLAEYADTKNYPEATDVAEKLAWPRTEGFLVQAACPVREYLPGDGSTYVSGWGYYRTCWLYAATTEDIPKVCMEWANKMLDIDKAKERKPVKWS